LFIRRLVSEDYSFLLELWEKAEFFIGKSDTEEEYIRFIKFNPETSLGIIVEEKMIGAVLGGFDGRRGTIHHLVVDEKYQQNGYGEILMTELIKRFRDMNVVKVSLWVKSDNSKVISFYENIGFEFRNDLYTMSYQI
jgi:ribosomal protein S18 acetylase RimI-like enzyme